MAAGTRQGRIVAALARVAAPLALLPRAGAASAIPYADPKPTTPQLLSSKLGVLESAIVDDGAACSSRARPGPGPRAVRYCASIGPARLRS